MCYTGHIQILDYIKSEYNILCEAMNNEEASSSNSNDDKKFRKSLWKLQVPNKVEFFLWRASTDSLHTTLQNLLKRKIVPVHLQSV